jgi:CheY-like chemotaxis protein
MRVLIVDDDLVQVTLLSELLEIFEGDHVSNGEDALLLFKQAYQSNHFYDLIFMDLMMPGVDGYMLLEAIRDFESKYSMPRTKVIVVSGKSAESGLTDQLNEQCDDYLVKPVSSEIICKSLENLGVL